VLQRKALRANRRCKLAAGMAHAHILIPFRYGLQRAHGATLPRSATINQ
jgi:hypothetical protein